MSDYLVDLVVVPGRQLAVCHGRTDRAGVATFLAEAFRTVAAALTASGVDPAGPAVASYRLTADGLDIAAGYPCEAPLDGADGVVLYALPGTEVLTTVHVGPYDQLGHAYEALTVHAGLLGRKLDPTAPMWEDYLSGPEVPAAIARTAVSWPLVPRRVR